MRSIISLVSLEHTESCSTQPDVTHEPSQLKSNQQISQQQQQQETTSQQITKTTKQSLIQPPKILPLQAQCAQKGSTVKFETTFTGCPTPLLTWYKDKKSIRFTRELQVNLDFRSSDCEINKQTKNLFFFVVADVPR